MSPIPIWRSDFSRSKIDFKITLTSIWPHFSLLFECSLHLQSFAACFLHSCGQINLLLFSLTFSLFSYNLVAFWGGRGMHSPWREPREPESSRPGKELPRVEGRDGSTEGRGVGLQNGSPSYCLGFPAGLFLVHTGLSHKGLQPSHTLINHNNPDNRQTNTTFLLVDRSNSNLDLLHEVRLPIYRHEHPGAETLSPAVVYS